MPLRHWLYLTGVLAAMLLLWWNLADAATACRSARQHDGRHWAWRQVEGRRCWYAGPVGVNKATLYWPRSSSAPTYRSPAERLRLCCWP